jgi:hypothetical protein
MMAWVDRRSGQSKKMGNVKVDLDGYSFGSKLEAAVYKILKERLQAGQLRSIQVQDHIYLTRARIGYITDFKCTMESGDVYWVEAKGFSNDRWPIKKKLWKYYGEGPLHIYKGTYLKPYLDEVITPERGSDV